MPEMPGSSTQLTFDWLADVNYARDEGRFGDAIDLYTKMGVKPPDELLAAYAAMLQKGHAANRIYKVEWYKGRIRVWAMKPGAPVADED
jgi:hypothetical protein